MSSNAAQIASDEELARYLQALEHNTTPPPNSPASPAPPPSPASQPDPARPTPGQSADHLRWLLGTLEDSTTVSEADKISLQTQLPAIIGSLDRLQTWVDVGAVAPAGGAGSSTMAAGGEEKVEEAGPKKSQQESNDDYVRAASAAVDAIAAKYARPARVVEIVDLEEEGLEEEEQGEEVGGLEAIAEEEEEEL